MLVLKVAAVSVSENGDGSDTHLISAAVVVK